MCSNIVWSVSGMNRLERINLPGPRCVVTAAKRVLRSCDTFGDVSPIKRQTLSAFLNDLDVVKSLPGVNVEELDEINSTINKIKQVLEGGHAELEPVSIVLPVTEISVEQIQERIALGQTLTSIAKDENCHRQTLQRLLKKNETSVRAKFSTISNEALTTMITDYNKDHENSGVIEIQGWLRSRGFVVQRSRCRRILNAVDGQGRAIRKAATIQRRSYYADSANAWWHIDAHCSLDKWGIWVHGGIDGYSRKVIYLNASNCNTKAAAACHFVAATARCGVPSRTRMDRGSENNDIVKFLEKVNGEERGSAVQGTSTHNVRIERLWRDVFTKALCYFYILFFHMEDHQILNREDEVQMFCLQHVFLPRINRFLQEWKGAWNNRSCSSLHGQSPDLTWIQDLQEKARRTATTVAISNAVQPPLEAIRQAVADFDIPEDVGQFLVPRNHIPLLLDETRELKQTINVLQPSSKQGLDIYSEVYRFVLRKIRGRQRS